MLRRTNKKCIGARLALPCDKSATVADTGVAREAPKRRVGAEAVRPPQKGFPIVSPRASLSPYPSLNKSAPSRLREEQRGLRTRSLDSDDFGLTYFVIASGAKQSRAVYACSGLPRGFAALNDDSIRCHLHSMSSRSRTAPPPPRNDRDHSDDAARGGSCARRGSGWTPAPVSSRIDTPAGAGELRR